MSLAMFAALVAAITVAAAMTVVGALALLYYSTGDRAEDGLDDVTHLHLPRDAVSLGFLPRSPGLLPAVAPVGTAQTPEPPPSELYPADSATRIHTPRVPGLSFGEQDSSLNRDLTPFARPNRASWADPDWDHGSGPRAAMHDRRSRFDRAMGPTPQSEPPNAAFGTPEWTEEEGATEIFSAHNLGDMSEFAFVDDEAPVTRR